MTKPWIIGNLKKEDPAGLVQRIVSGDSYGLQTIGGTSWAALCARYGDSSSDRVFSMEDYQVYLVNRYLEEILPYDR